MNPLLQQAIGSILRHFLTALSGYLVTYGIWTQDESGKYVEGAVLFLLSVAWALYQKYTSRQKLVTAMAAEKRMSEQQVENVIALGGASSVLTPKNEVPA